MKVYIFPHVAFLTDSYHSDGGLVVIAQDDEHVREIIVSSPGTYCPDKEEWANATILDVSDDTAPDIFVYPNAGCC